MAVPKKKLSKARIGKRRGSSKRKLKLVEVSKCQATGLPTPPHRMNLKKSGHYKGKKIVAVLA